MTHPYFDTLHYPSGRPESAELLKRLVEAYPEARNIQALYEDSGGALGFFRGDLEPIYIWRDTLQKLTRQRRLRALFEKILNEHSDTPMGEAVRAIIDLSDRAPVAEYTPYLRLSDSATWKNFQVTVVDQAPFCSGLSVFVSPYAAYDVDKVGDPRQLAQLLLSQSFDKLKEGSEPDLEEPDLDFDTSYAGLSNLLVATSSGVAMSGTPDLLWERMCDIADAEVGQSRLYQELAGLAGSWQEFGNVRTGDQTTWGGLLYFTLGMNCYLENELADARVDFGVLNLISDGRASYHKSRGRNHAGQLQFEDKWVTPPVAVGFDGKLIPAPKKRGAKEPNYLPEEKVVIVKLMGFSQLRNRRPLLGLEMMNLLRNRGKLPASTIANHLGEAPFIMLGGGLFDPFVALTFEAYFRDAGRSASRWLVMHPALPDDMLRITEHAINRFRRGWTGSVYGMNLLVADLADATARISSRIVDNAPARSAA